MRRDSHWDQSPARRKDAVLAGGICCAPDEQVRHGIKEETLLHRLHVRRDNTPILEFEDKILHILIKPARGGKWEPRFHPGVFVGLLNSSSEAVVVTEQGLAIKIRIIPESEKWDADRILGMREVSWDLDGSDNACDMQVGMERPAEVVPRPPGEVLMGVPVPENWPEATAS